MGLGRGRRAATKNEGESSKRHARSSHFMPTCFSCLGASLFSPAEEASRRRELAGGGQGRNRTTDTRIFSPLLYRLSYLAFFGFVAFVDEAAILHSRTKQASRTWPKRCRSRGGRGDSSMLRPRFFRSARLSPLDRTPVEGRRRVGEGVFSRSLVPSFSKSQNLELARKARRLAGSTPFGDPIGTGEGRLSPLGRARADEIRRFVVRDRRLVSKGGSAV